MAQAQRQNRLKFDILKLKHLDASRSVDAVIKQLEDTELVHKESITLLKE